MEAEKLRNYSMHMKTLYTILALCIATPCLAEMVINDPYARASRPGAPTGAAFFTIQNTGDTGDRLIAAASPVAKMVELHTHIQDGDIMRMRPIEGGIEIPAGETHELARGGDHVMLMGLTETLEDGDEIEVTLTFEEAGEVTLVVPVDNKRGQHGSQKH